MELPTPAFPRKAVWILTLLGLGLRLWFNLIQHPPGNFVFSDMGVYDLRAQNLLHGTLTPIDTFTPVGYPAFLAFFYALTNRSIAVVAFAQAVLGGLTAWLAALVSWRLSRSRSAAVVSCLITAAYLPLLSYGGLLMSEVPFSFVAVLAVLLLMRARETRTPGSMVCAGLALSLATVIRPQLTLLYPLLPFFFWASFRGDHKIAVRSLCIVVAASLPLFALVSFHNSRLLGHATGLGTNGGLNFFLAHSDYKTVEYWEGTRQHAITPIPNSNRYLKMFTSPVPFYEEGFYYREGLKVLASNPLRIVTDLRNITEGLGLGRTDYWPGWIKYQFLLNTFGRPFFWVILLPGLAASLLPSVRRRLWWPDGADRLLILLVLLSVFVTLYVFLGDPRMRVPFDPLFIALAADAAVRIRAARIGK